jgi:hypothetical protein
MVQRFWRTALSGVLGGLVFSQLTGLTFYDLGVRPGILFNPQIQSPKVMAAVQTQPLPVMMATPYVACACWTLVVTGWAFLFNHVSVLWPEGFWRRTGRLTLVMWFFSFFFFEFQGPFNLLHEPVPLVSLELVFWAICALGAAAVIVVMQPRQRGERTALATGLDLVAASQAGGGR